jgi:N-acetyl-D-muramate 6-phosphate phosphatase
MPASATTRGIDTSKVRGLLFDVDGTLSDTDDHMVQQIAGFFQPISWFFKNKDPREFSRRLVMFCETPGNFLYTLADRLGIDGVVAGIYNLLAQKHLAHPNDKDEFKIIPGVKDMLSALAGRFPMAVVSARDAHTTMRFLEAFELLHFFEVVVTSQTCRHTKPFPDPVIFAAGQLGLTADLCLMIGDTVVDVRSGKAAGAQTLAVLCGFGTQRELRRAGADLILTSTPDLLEILPSGCSDLQF